MLEVARQPSLMSFLNLLRCVFAFEVRVKWKSNGHWLFFTWGCLGYYKTWFFLGVDIWSLKKITGKVITCKLINALECHIIEHFYSRGQHLCKFIGTIKRKRLHKKRVQLPQDWFGTPTCPPFHCFGTPIWPPWRHVKQSIESLLNKINMEFAAYLLENGL